MHPPNQPPTSHPLPLPLEPVYFRSMTREKRARHGREMKVSGQSKIDCLYVLCSPLFSFSTIDDKEQERKIKIREKNGGVERGLNRCNLAVECKRVPTVFFACLFVLSESNIPLSRFLIVIHCPLFDPVPTTFAKKNKIKKSSSYPHNSCGCCR